MKTPGFFHGAVRVAAFPAAVICLAGVTQAAVPEAAAPRSVAGEYHSVADRLVRLERELNDLQRTTYSRLAARRTGPQTTTDGGYSGSSDVDQQRLSDLETALRELTGRVEQLEHQMRQLDRRMRQLAASTGPAGPGQARTTDQTGSQPDASGDHAPRGPGQPRNLAEIIPPSSGSSGGMSMPGMQPADPEMPRPGAPSSQPDDGETDSEDGTPSNIPKLSGDDGRDFNTARQLVLDGEFARAGDMFGAIVKAYPESKYAGDSQFWRAETLYVRELYRDAAEAYLTVARDFPDSSRAPHSLVKLALSFDKLGERKQACAALAQLDRRYPKAPEQVRQNAEQYEEQFSCT